MLWDRYGTAAQKFIITAHFLHILQMAYIEKLLIRGIRSFGPAEEDEAQLKFTTPLTIILGQNGCGKTTVIEALKYGTCGETPGLGSGFVHDPKLNNSSEVCFGYCLIKNKVSILFNMKCVHWSMVFLLLQLA